MLKIAMLSTGEEVLHGDIVDTNAAWLSEQFFEAGFPLSKRATVGDELSSLVEELMMLSFNNQVVVVNGGLGPTSDDLSSEAAAKAGEQSLKLFPEWQARLEGFFAQRKMVMPESNIKQAMLPEKATLVDNPIGTACGFSMLINDCLFYFTPGVPSEFKMMVEQQILPDLKQRYPQQAGLECSRFYTFGTSESALSDKLDRVQLPAGYMLGYRSYLPFIEVKLFGPKGDLSNKLGIMKIINQLIDTHVVSIDEPMIQHIASLLDDAQLSLSTSEQSTGGWLSNWLQSEAAAEKWCGHGWILGGAVSVGDDEQDPLAATLALAGATRQKCSTELSLVTGKVTDNQFSVALATPQGEWGQVLTFSRQYNRENQRLLISTVALDMLRRYLAKKPMFVSYSSVGRVKDIFVPAEQLQY